MPRITWIIWIITAVVGVALIAAYGYAFKNEYQVPLAKAASGNLAIRIKEDSEVGVSSNAASGEFLTGSESGNAAPDASVSAAPGASTSAAPDASLPGSDSNAAPGNVSLGDTTDSGNMPSDFEDNSSTIVEEEPSAPPKYVALTFDDGPSEKATKRILDTLEEYGARATFFAVGYNISPYKDHLKRMLEIDCEVANHTSNHPHLTKLSKDRMRKEIFDNEALIRKVCDLPEDEVVLLRPPYGEYDRTVLDMLTMPAVCWSLDSLDWKSRNCDAIVQLVRSKAEDGNVILMHDLYDSTADAVSVLVPWFIENGYELVTVSELYELKGETLRPGHVYSKAENGD